MADFPRERGYGYNDGPFELRTTKDQVGGKPVILILSPSFLPKVDVHLSLCPSWEFSAIYPLSPVLPSKHETGTNVTWSVSASPNGTLVDLSTNISVTYLFWEATSKIWTPPSPPLLPAVHNSLLTTNTTFDPSNPYLSSANATVLPFEHFLLHLSDALSALTLSISARTDFITF